MKNSFPISNHQKLLILCDPIWLSCVILTHNEKKTPLTEGRLIKPVNSV